MTRHYTIQMLAGYGTPGERGFTPHTICSGDCKKGFPDDELTESKTLGGYYCDECWEIEEQRHLDSPDYDGKKFD